ncbi:rsbT co-antagonist protein RsbR [Planomicrobium soli]|uniref:RsbT co-antagonist protein RsbR n=1 Tax=Planomicrobium soli TaxID=1176648 RepID=A0A2P8GQV0_9BACL|nr:STAS domain-containing protein [Planomicrobium soli]PSL36315.1 rsbT co-antagonist protein RsbR [Planomicrobium soli]
MLKNQELHDFLCEKNKELTAQWYETLDKSVGGVYGSNNPEAIERLKQQNYEFHMRFCSMFDTEEIECLENFQDWIMRVSKDEGHLSTPLAAILKEFFRTQLQYVNLIKEFAAMHKDISSEQLDLWKQAVILKTNEIILEFTVQHTAAAERRLNAQKEMIVEMSAPVILLTKEMGLLPLIGEIDTYRARIMFEKVLKQCHDASIERLFIDLSGVPIIDTMVAHQIFQLIDGLKIIGVKTALSGISPDIAQTAVQLGINFGEIEIYNTLTQAIKLQGLKVQRLQA